MSETAIRLPRARTSKNPAWLDALEVYKRSFDATSAESLTDGAEAFAEMSPDDQAFHHAHLAFRQVQALGDVFGVLRRIETRLAGLDSASLVGLKDLPVMKKALISIARGQNSLLRMVAQGGLADAINGDGEGDDDDSEDGESDDDDSDGESDDDDLDGEGAETIEDEDHDGSGGGGGEALMPEVLPAGARKPPVELP